MFQLPNPTTDPPPNLFRNLLIPTLDNPFIIVQQLIQLLPRRRPIIRRIRSILLRLLGRNLKLIPRRTVQLLDLLNCLLDARRSQRRGGSGGKVRARGGCECAYGGQRVGGVEARPLVLGREDGDAAGLVGGRRGWGAGPGRGELLSERDGVIDGCRGCAEGGLADEGAEGDGARGHFGRLGCVGAGELCDGGGAQDARAEELPV